MPVIAAPGIAAPGIAARGIVTRGIAASPAPWWTTPRPPRRTPRRQRRGFSGAVRLVSTVQGSPAGGDIDALLIACAGGDRAAFRELYQRQSPRLYGLALRMTQDGAMAADALHDALLQAWQRAGSFDARLGSAEGWLTGLLRYRVIDLIRKYGRERSGLSLDLEAADATPDPLDQLLASTDADELHRCLGTLDEKQRRAVVLSFMEGLSHTELAEHLASPLGTVKSWIRRGVLALRACLSP